MPYIPRASEPGFHVTVRSATPESEIIVIVRNTAPGTTKRLRPIYWGTDEMQTLTPEERAVIDDLIPAALYQDRTPPADPVRPTLSVKLVLTCAAGCTAFVGLLMLTDWLL